MKRIFIILIALFIFPICIKAATINTSFNSENCVLTINGTQTGHEATVFIFDGDTNIGTKTNEINNGNYSTYFVLSYESSKTISVTVSNESGTDEETKSNVVIPACIPVGLAPGKVDELYDSGNSIIVNNKRNAFDPSDTFQVHIYDMEGVEELLSQLDGEEFDQAKMQFDAIMDNLGKHKLFIAYFDLFINNPERFDDDEEFVLNISVPKDEYTILKGLKFVTLDRNLKFSKELNYTYDQENEILSISINGLNGVIAYLDNNYKFKDLTGRIKYILKKDGDLTIKVDAPYDNFLDVYIDDKLVDSKYYTVKSGSTVITLKKDFMQNLKAGNHTLTVGFTDGEAKTNISVLDEGLNPKTSDSIFKYIILGIISTIGIIIGIIYLKKNLKK